MNFLLFFKNNFVDKNLPFLKENLATLRYWDFKEEALDRTVWRTRFGRGYGIVVRQTA
jgi:hypothetical protein